MQPVSASEIKKCQIIPFPNPTAAIPIRQPQRKCIAAKVIDLPIEISQKRWRYEKIRKFTEELRRLEERRIELDSMIFALKHY